jgi:hypothetical protein
VALTPRQRRAWAVPVTRYVPRPTDPAEVRAEVADLRASRARAELAHDRARAARDARGQA